MTDATNRDWLTKDEAEAFIGKNSSFYLEKWKLHSESTLKGWNWAALFFSIEWMAYRKMYAEAILSFMLVLTISFGISAIFIFGIGADFSFTLGRIVGDISRLSAGIFGNYLYRKKAIRVLKSVIHENDTERLNYLKRKGGVNAVGVIFCITFEIAYALILI